MATHFKGPVISENGFQGAITGAVTGNITGNVTGNLTGNVTGNISGNQSGGSVSATTVAASTSLAVGGGVAVKAIKSDVVSVDAGTLAAQTALDVDVTITGVAAGDAVVIMPLDASMEAGLAVQAVWVSAADHVKIRLFNNNAVAALSGGAQNWTYLWMDLT